MKKILLFILPMFMVALVGCSSMKTFDKVPAGSMTPKVQLNINLDDIEYLGEDTISVSTRKYGSIKRIDLVNGEIYDRRNHTITSMVGNLDINTNGNDRDLELALYKIIKDYPEADYFVPVYYKDEVLKMFMGKRSTKTMVIKAYKLKVK